VGLNYSVAHNGSDRTS